MAAKYTDDEIQRWVEEELEWTPGLDSAGIGVSVDDGAVRLSGEVADLSDGRTRSVPRSACRA